MLFLFCYMYLISFLNENLFLLNRLSTLYPFKWVGIPMYLISIIYYLMDIQVLRNNFIW